MTMTTKSKCEHATYHAACVACGACVEYPSGLNLRGGRVIHATCWRERRKNREITLDTFLDGLKNPQAPEVAGR